MPLLPKFGKQGLPTSIGAKLIGVGGRSRNDVVLGRVGGRGLFNDRAKQGPVRRDPIGHNIPFGTIPLLEGHVAVALMVLPGHVDRME
jgi:hypothetical protein